MEPFVIDCHTHTRDHTYIYTPYFCMFVSLYLVYTCYQSWPLTTMYMHAVLDPISNMCACWAASSMWAMYVKSHWCTVRKTPAISACLLINSGKDEEGTSVGHKIQCKHLCLVARLCWGVYLVPCHVLLCLLQSWDSSSCVNSY